MVVITIYKSKTVTTGFIHIRKRPKIIKAVAMYFGYLEPSWKAEMHDSSPFQSTYAENNKMQNSTMEEREMFRRLFIV